MSHHPTTVLTLKNIFGLKGDVKNNIHYFDETHVIYPVGHNIIVYNIESKVQYKIQSLGDMKEKDSSLHSHTEINSLAISPNRKYLAVAERGERPQLTIFDISTIGAPDSGPWKKKRPNIPADISSPEFVCLAFSPDSKSLLTLGGAPDWSLTLWHWEKGRAVTSIRVSNAQGSPVYTCSFSPNDPSFVCVTGNGVLKFFRVDPQSGEFKPIQSSIGKREPQNYINHAWLDDKLLIATDTGDILIYGDGGEYRGPVGTPCETNIATIIAYGKGFICGCGDGILQIYEKDEKEGFKKKPPFSIKHNPSHVLNLSLSPSEDNLVCTTDNNQAYILPLTSSDVQDLKIDLLAQPFHHMVITGMDVCVRKPLVVTCGIDKSVRVWNYLDSSLELMKYFPEEPYSVAIHPSGLTILVGFNDKLRLMNLLIEDIRAYKEFPIKSCRECQFSNGGQYFAAVNGTTIQVYSTYSCENIGNCRGHNGKVRSISWLPDDTGFVSAGMDGAVFEWEIKDGSHVQEFIQKGCNYSSAVITPDNKIFAAGSDRTLKEITASQPSGSWDIGISLSQLALSHPSNPLMLFAGSDTGLIKYYKFPLANSFYDHYVHSSGITRLRLSRDDTFLFSASEDGSLAIFEVAQKDRSRKEKGDLSLQWAEEILVTKSDLEEKLSVINDLKNKVEELHLHNEYQSRLREVNFQEKLRDITEVFNKELADDKSNYEKLMQEKIEMEKQFAMKMSELSIKHDDKIQQLESFQEQKTESEHQRYNELQRKLDLGIEKWKDMLVQRQLQYRDNVENLKNEYNDKLSEEINMCQTLSKERYEIDTFFEDLKINIETDADIEIDELKELFDKKIWNEKETEQKYSAENGILKLRYNGLKEEIKRQKDEIKAKFDREKGLYEQIHILEKDIEGFKKEISERDMTIDDKKQRIYDLRKKNQELEKFKFVLDYKIKELRRQIEPRELEIKEMQTQISEMEAELSQYRHGYDTQKLRVQELDLKLRGMNNEGASQKDTNVKIELSLLSIQNDLHDVVQNYEGSSDIKNLKVGMKKIYQKHITKDIRAEADPDVHKEYQRQRYYLEKSVDTLKRKLDKDNTVHKKENIRIIQENVALIREINELRKEIKYLQDSSVAPSQVKRRNQSASRLPILIDEMQNNSMHISQLEQELMTLQKTGSRVASSSSFFPAI